MKLEIKSKKAVSHIEIILSFVIFAGFVTFIFSVFNPFSVREASELHLNIVERAIKDFISLKIELLALRLNQTPDKCFYFNYTFESNIIVKNEKDEFVDASNNGKNTYIDNKGEFFYIYSCEIFEEQAVNYPECIKIENYTLGLHKDYEMVSYDKLVELKNYYENNYSALKESFKIPENEDFLFSVSDTLGSIELTTEKTIPRTRVSARNVPIQLAYKNGTFRYAILNIQTW